MTNRIVFRYVSALLGMLIFGINYAAFTSSQPMSSVQGISSIVLLSIIAGLLLLSANAARDRYLRKGAPMAAAGNQGMLILAEEGPTVFAVTIALWVACSSVF